MKVAIVHHHLGRGGVTTVIARASRALAGLGIRHVILAGETPAPVVDSLPLRMVPGLGYDGKAHAGELLETMRRSAAEALGCQPDLWHFHNHSLGRNPLMAGLVERLADEGERLVLQLHDLAEDGRPQNLPALAACPRPYPFSPAVRYAFLNSRDLGLFTAAGLPPDLARLLPNPVPPAAETHAPPAGPPLVFAPVRGIRRKNIGELVLLSALAPAGTRFAISRAPLDAASLAIHDTWRDFCARLALPIGFDVVDRFRPAAGTATDFDTWIRHATHFASTSVGEGFGLAFLEAAAHGKPLVGRDIPSVTGDLARAGIRPGRLYQKLLVPLDWIDLPLLLDHLRTALERDHRFTSTPVPPTMCDEIIDRMVDDGRLDFGNLPEPLQQGVIERLDTPSARAIPRVVVGDGVLPAQEWLEGALRERTSTVPIGKLAPWSPESFGKSLAALYQEIVTSTPAAPGFVPPARILAAYQTPSSFHFLKSAPPPRTNPSYDYKAVVFDIYGTLLIAPAGGVKPDPAADPVLREIIRQHGHEPPHSPSGALHDAVLRHHAAADAPFPEIDLRILWQEVLGTEDDTTDLVRETEAAWHPCRPMPGAAAFIRRLARQGVSLGLLSNAQCNTLGDLGGMRDLFPAELIILSYRHGIAKPSPALFALMAERLAHRGIRPAETLYIGNDPVQDIAPAAAAGFATALFTGHPDSLRDGDCRPDIEIRSWRTASIGSA